MLDKRAARILARSLIRELWASGDGRAQVFTLASALLHELGEKMRAERAAGETS